MRPLWHKGHDPADWLIRFTVGDDHVWDTILLPYDVTGTAAHVWGLGEAGVLTAEEVNRVHEALDRLRDEAVSGELVVTQRDEDMHTVIENALTNRLGDLGQKIHAGRSRNDQVLVALRLWLRDALKDVGRDARRIAKSLAGLAQRYPDVLIPGFTHTRPAMPSSAALWALGYAETLVGDLRLLGNAAREVNLSPWGSAAGYGVPHLDLPREGVAERLGFVGMQVHVTTVQLSRGKSEAAVVHALLQIALTLNRLSADVISMSAPDAGYLMVPTEATTGSSIMPQKRNPDVFELARAAAHRIMAELNLLLTLPTNLTSGYHRDLQLTKAAVMRSVLTASDLVAAMNEAVPGLTFDTDRAHAALTPDLFATEEALRRVVEDGLPFREAYREVAGRLDDLEVPPSDEALQTYVTRGTPGRVDPDYVLSAADSLDWLGA